MVAHKVSWERMCFLRAERGRKIVLITQIAFVLLIAFVTNPLLDQLYSFFSVSEHPMQSRVNSTKSKEFFFFVCVCVGGGGGGGGEAPLPPPPPRIRHCHLFTVLSPPFFPDWSDQFCQRAGGWLHRLWSERGTKATTLCGHTAAQHA